MMPRSIDATLLAAITATHYRPVLLASLAFKSETIHCWSGRGSLVWNEMTFTGVGSLGKLGAVGNASAGVVESGTSVELSGIDATILGETMSDCTPGGAVSIWLGAWGEGALIGTPYLLWRGYLGQPLAQPDVDRFMVVLQLSTSLAQLNRATCRRYTAADQRLYYPDDSGFNWVEILNDIAFRWGN